MLAVVQRSFIHKVIGSHVIIYLVLPPCALSTFMRFGIPYTELLMRCSATMLQGVYSGQSRSPPTNGQETSESHTLWTCMNSYIEDTLDSLWRCRAAVSLLSTIIILAIFIPLITRAVHNTSETKMLRNMVTSMSRGIYEAKSNCDKVCSIHCSLKERCTQTDNDIEPCTEPCEDVDSDSETLSKRICSSCDYCEETPKDENKWIARKILFKRIINPKRWCET